MKFGMDKCPLCRTQFVEKTAEEGAAQKMSLAERGVLWAQKNVGKGMIQGIEGFEKQEDTGLEWLKQAAAQNHPSSLMCLSNLYREGSTSVLRKSQEKADELLLKAANLGFASANSKLAVYYLIGFNDFEKDPVEAYFRASVAFALDDKNQRAVNLLGGFHFDEHHVLPEPSPYLACYYLNIATNEDTDGSACYSYGKALFKLSDHLQNYNGFPVPGFDVTPAEYFWLRKSRDIGLKEAGEFLRKLQSKDQSHCGYCVRKVQPGEKLKECSKCRARLYCSKECQIEAWWAGHNKDCKRAKISTFDDYLNV